MDIIEAPLERFDDLRCCPERGREHLLAHIQRGIPTVARWSCIRDYLPRREDFINPKLSAAVAAMVNRGERILFMPVSVMERTDFIGGIKRYVIYMFGILPDGSKTCVYINDVYPYLDILLEGKDVRKETDELRRMLSSSRVYYNSMEVVEKYKAMEFTEAPCKWAHVTFLTMADRKAAIDYARNNKLTLANDDSEANDTYINVLARQHYFNTAGWNILKKYTPTEGWARQCTEKCAYTLSVSLADFVAVGDELKAWEDGPLGSAIVRDNTLVRQWDIETYSTVQNGMVPRPGETTYNIFMICSSYYWYHSAAPLLSVCVCDVPLYAHKSINLTIICDGEKELLAADMEITGRMMPDIQAAFNGGNFDTPLVRDRMIAHRMMADYRAKISVVSSKCDENGAARWSYKRERVKINAEVQHELEQMVFLPGMLDIDVYPIFYKLHSTVDVGRAGSLNRFLELNKLPLKADMPYTHMFRIYERALKLRAVRGCHCDTATAALCETCTRHVRDLDHEPEDMTGREINYDTVKYSDRLRAGVGAKCCWCVKRPRNYVDMAEVAYYCFIDTLRPQQLCIKRAILSDKRALANWSFTTLYDAFFRADGMKVRNFFGNGCAELGVAFSNARPRRADHEKDHYAGAWVFPPIRGLNRRRPVTGLDFRSLYPSIMMNNNMSPDMVVKDPAMAERLIAAGYRLTPIGPLEYEKGEKKGAAENKKHSTQGWTVHHNGIYGPADTHIITYYVKNKVYADDTKVPVAKIIDGRIEPLPEPAPRDGKYSVKYTSVRDGRAALPNERFGVVPYVIKRLFDKRVPIKEELKKYTHIKELFARDNVTTLVYKGVTYDYDDVCFRYNMVDSQQKAVKVLMNTFYGESGNFRSPIYELLVAAGITSLGQMNIKRVANFVVEKGYRVIYGDTDSLYLECPDKIYAAVDAEYAAALAGDGDKLAAREKYWTAMVNLTMADMLRLQQEVAEFLIQVNGTHFLEMAYEEVGFPTAICGKKKYFMIPHIGMPNFHSGELMIKGIDIIKQGQAKITRMIGETIIKESMRIDNESELIDIVVDVIKRCYTQYHEPDMFVQKAKYKPKMKNVAVNTFMRRMQNIQKKYAGRTDREGALMYALYAPTDPGDRFDYVVVKKPTEYTVRGTRVRLGKGDKMEYLRVFQHSLQTECPMEIDLDHYVESMVIGVCARFLSYHDMFQPAEGAYDALNDYREMDQYCITKASQYLTEVCRGVGGIDEMANPEVGRQYRAIWRNISQNTRHSLYQRVGGAAEIIDGAPADEDVEEATPETVRLTTYVGRLCERAAEGPKYNFGAPFVARVLRTGMNPISLRRIYLNSRSENLMKRQLESINAWEQQQRAIIAKLAPVAREITRRRQDLITALIEDVRSDNGRTFTNEDIDYINNMTPEECTAMQELKAALRSIRAAAIRRDMILDIAKAINDSVIGAVPNINPRAEAAKIAKSADIVTVPDEWWP